jgi:hypothetical protein
MPDEEEKINNDNPENMIIISKNEEEKQPKSKKFSVLNEIRDDKNFKAFLDKFFVL